MKHKIVKLVNYIYPPPQTHTHIYIYANVALKSEFSVGTGNQGYFKPLFNRQQVPLLANLMSGLPLGA